MKVFYYYYYLFYTKVLPDNQPHATVVFTLSFTLASLINGILNIFLAHLVGIALGKWEMIGIFILVMGINFLFFYRKDKGNGIIKMKPKFFNNQNISILLTAIFVIVSVSFLFWSPIYVRDVLSK